MNQRQEQVLKRVVELYIDHVTPIGSKLIADELVVSSATIRNDMMALESEGMLVQPHTSAGRVPTQQAYEYYLKHFVRRDHAEPASRLKTNVRQAPTHEQASKELAKELGELTGEMVVVAIGTHWRYLTGAANLFQKPDFTDFAQLQSLSLLVDAFDEVLDELFAQVPDQPLVMIGGENPFGSHMSSLLVRYQANEREALIGIIGPLRMHYGRNLALLERAKQLLDSHAL